MQQPPDSYKPTEKWQPVIWKAQATHHSTISKVPLLEDVEYRIELKGNESSDPGGTLPNPAVSRMGLDGLILTEGEDADLANVITGDKEPQARDEDSGKRQQCQTGNQNEHHRHLSHRCGQRKWHRHLHPGRHHKINGRIDATAWPPPWPTATRSAGSAAPYGSQSHSASAKTNVHTLGRAAHQSRPF